ncbi:hypothetical protein DPEC_G00086790 [Dallia pectoralis]|uniref:Uncharacterized protein n=1 Tax=Dallia pectoralis TaxID=75939 RepID=A0ACC2H0P3_DALPE|nr:hypothetical protein DPEC_G00086790 [Dallia pectoralis]
MPTSLGLSFGLLLFSLGVLGSPSGYSIPEGVDIQAECRDRYLWVHVGSSDNAPIFEAVDAAGVHPIEGDAPQCGYTISSFKMDVYTTLRASYFSCYTGNQNDEVFTFQLYITVTDAEGRPARYPLAQTCILPLPWSQREVICEEDYMEVSVGRNVLCTTPEGTSKEAWEAAHSIAQKMANSVWQVMFLNNEEKMAAMSVVDAQQLGYELTATPKRVVFRSPYGQNHSEIVMVDGVPVEVIRGTVFFRQNMMVVMVDISVACTKNPGSFDGARILWDTPKVITPLVDGNFGFESKRINVGVENQLLDEGTARARGYTLEVKGPLVQMGVPFGAKGGYTKSLVMNNVYQETYTALLFYEHVFSHVYADGSSVETRHRLCRVVVTPLLCHTPFTIDVDTLSPYRKTSAEVAFNVYLGNIPHDVALMGVKLNENLFLVTEAADRGYTISTVEHTNGSHGYTLSVPLDDKSVQRTYLGDGLLQYSVDINYTLSIMPQEESYFHVASVVKQLTDAFPPELRGVCTQRGVVFNMNQPRLGYLWEIGAGHDPLTPQLVAERGYYLINDSHSLTLEVPRLTNGYIYEDINLKRFTGTFEVLLRDSQTSEIQTSTATRCHFKTDQLIICSTDGTVTVVTNTRTPWPGVDPHSTTLSDRTCQPKETDDSRVLFEFGLNTCGTTLTVEGSHAVYENKILSNREVKPDGDSFMSRDSKFRVTVRCIYPLNSVNRLSVDNLIQSEVPGVGSITFTGSTEDDPTDDTTRKTVPGCKEQVYNRTKNASDIDARPLRPAGGHHGTHYESSTAGKPLNPKPTYYNNPKGSRESQTSSNGHRVSIPFGLSRHGGIGEHGLSNNGAPVLKLPSQLSVNEYRNGKRENAMPASGHYGSSVGRTEIVHSGAKHKADHYNNAQGTVYQTSRLRPASVQPTPYRFQPAELGSANRPKLNNTNVYTGNLDNGLTFRFYVTNFGKKFVPAASKDETIKGNRLQQATNLYGEAQTRILTHTQGGSSQDRGQNINQLVTGQYGGFQTYRAEPAASQPNRIPSASSSYASTHSPSHLASPVNIDQPPITQYGNSQSYRITPAPSKYLASQFFSIKHKDDSARGKHFTTQRHNIPKMTGHEASQIGDNPATTNWPGRPSQYDPQSGKREHIPSQSAAVYHIKPATVNHQRGGGTASLHKPQPVSSQYESSQSSAVNQTPPKINIQQMIQPATNEKDCSVSIRDKPSTKWPTRVKSDPNPQGSPSGRNEPDANAQHHADSARSDPNDKCSQGHSGRKSPFLKVSSSRMGYPIISKDMVAQNNPSRRVSPIYSLLNQGSAKSGTAKSEDEQVLGQSSFAQNPPSHFQPTFQAGDSSGISGPNHGTSSNTRPSEPHGGNRQGPHGVETSLDHRRLAHHPSFYQSPSKVQPAVRHYDEYKDRDGVHENTEGSHANPRPSQYASPSSFYRTLQSNSKKPLSRTSVQAPSRYVAKQTQPGRPQTSPGSLQPPGQYDANSLNGGQMVLEHLGYLSNLNERTQGGGISTENGKDQNRIKESGNHINSDQLNYSENCPSNNSEQSSFNSPHPSSSGPGVYTGNVHEGVLRGRRSQ